MEVSKTKLDGVLLVKPQVFEDFRGQYVETYNDKLYAEHGITAKFVQDDISVSSRHVLRGIHGDAQTWKLVSCLYGKFYLVVVNCDKQSRGFGQWQSFVLSNLVLIRINTRFHERSDRSANLFQLGRDAEINHNFSSIVARLLAKGGVENQSADCSRKKTHSPATGVSRMI